MKTKRIAIAAVTSILTVFSIASCNTPVISETGKKITAAKTSGWQVLPSMPEPRYNLQAVMVNGEIYASGGLSDTILTSFEKFSPLTKTWEKLPELTMPRYIHNSVYLNGFLYLIGGYSFNENTDRLLRGQSSRGALNSVERYSLASGKWESVAPLKQSRFMAGAAVFNNKIYVAGGARQGKILDTVEVYDPAKNTWETVSRMPQPVVWGKLLSDGRYMYLVGGSAENNEFLASVDRYDPIKNEWQKDYFPPMSVKRFAHGAAITENGIYVAGGSNENGFVDSVEFLDFGTGQWQSLSKIIPPRGGAELLAVKTGLYLFGTDAWYTNNTLFFPFSPML